MKKNMDTQTRLNIEAECHNVFVTYGHALDDANGAVAAAQFTTDGVWDRQGAVTRGADAIRKIIDSRPATRMTRHIFTNILIRVIDDNNAEGRAYYTVYAHESSEPDGGPMPRPFTGPQRVGDYMSTFVRTPQGWRLSAVVPKRIFNI